MEQQQINFQTFFFEALQQKAIGNYDKAIFALDACYEINSDNVTLDLAGYSLQSTAAGGRGILDDGQQNIHIKNGSRKMSVQYG